MFNRPHRRSRAPPTTRRRRRTNRPGPPPPAHAPTSSASPGHSQAGQASGVLEGRLRFVTAETGHQLPDTHQPERHLVTATMDGAEDERAKGSCPPPEPEPPSEGGATR